MRSFLGWMRSVLKRLETAWAVAGLTILIIGVGDLGLRGIFWLKDRNRPQIPPDPRVLSAIDGSADWLPTHYRELEILSDRWRPYVYFRQRPLRGQTIRIDEEGLRATWQPPDAGDPGGEGAPRARLLMLGGSSLWGFGARDDATIPSLVARGLHQRGLAVEVRNLAEIGYVSTQELIALVRELQGGYRPDVVLFYDGVNDTASALLEGEAAVTTNERNRVREFNILQSPSRLATALVASLVRGSGWFRLAGAIGRRVVAPPAPSERVFTGGDLPRLAGEVVRRYAATVNLVEALGREFGFRTLFIWQPVIFQKPKLVPFEHEESEKFGWARPLFLQVHDELERNAALQADPAFRDLSDIFRETESLVFLDFCHTTEEANGRIAEAIVPQIESMIRQMKNQ